MASAIEYSFLLSPVKMLLETLRQEDVLLVSSLCFQVWKNRGVCSDPSARTHQALYLGESCSGLKKWSSVKESHEDNCL